MSKNAHPAEPEETHEEADASSQCESCDKLEQELAEVSDKLIRAQAEAENQRKRHEQERAQLSKFALAGFIEDLLPVIDNFYRATEHVPAEQKDSPWVTGIQYIQKNLLDVLEARGVMEIPAKKGDHFNPDMHEAIGTRDEGEEDTILEVTNRGYKLHDRILRPTQVIVSKKS